MTHYIDTRKLISDIQIRPALWNRNYAVNKAFTEDTWDELSEIHQLPKSILKTRWKSLRDNFRIEFKRIPRDALGNCLISPNLHKSKWAYYKQLLFLVDHMKSRYPTQEPVKLETNVTNTFVRDLQGITPDNSSNMDYSDNYDDEYIQIPEVPSSLQITGSISPSCDAQNGQDSTPLPPLVPVAKRVFMGPKRARVEEPQSNGTNPEEIGDDDYHFLMSLHTYMSQLKDREKLKMRMKIQNIIYQELFNDDDENSNEKK
uniref:CSON009703 protein n=1 Tax=Culicoides sonorensis TaxID=179676 RepID=A0A336M0U7_CULSO